jgi:hypothetical protein
MTSRQPQVGHPLPRGAEAFGVRDKLESYSLNRAHKHGGPKARGFERILGITIDDIDYLEAQITSGVRQAPIASIREKPPHGTHCVVELPVRGIGLHSGRRANVRTVWEIAEPGDPPRLVSAYIKP